MVRSCPITNWSGPSRSTHTPRTPRSRRIELPSPGCPKPARPRPSRLAASPSPSAARPAQRTGDWRPETASFYAIPPRSAWRQASAIPPDLAARLPGVTHHRLASPDPTVTGAPARIPNRIRNMLATECSGQNRRHHHLAQRQSGLRHPGGFDQPSDLGRRAGVMIGLHAATQADFGARAKPAQPTFPNHALHAMTPP